jgi:hypothetical protein
MTNPQRIGTDLAEQKVLSDINEYGWHAIIIEDDGQPPWTFTIGLYETWKHGNIPNLSSSAAVARPRTRW